ncbi:MULTISPECIES: hypothetical protein [Pyrococcus]|uniref:hypothetical protein n=1 Tax=Pyrococcus TaxID=2260 RepID=UPI001CB7A71F|nr:hypothetical protein [Pyrococcus furiosus]
MKKYEKIRILGAGIIIIMLFLVASIVSDTRKEQVQGSFELYDPEKVRVVLPVVYYKLENGSIIRIHEKNPFPFSIKLSVRKATFPNSLTVYKIEKYKNPEKIFQIASKFGISPDKLYYNNITGAYLYHDSNITFEYETKTGFIRVVFKSPISSNLNGNITERALNFLKARGLLYMQNYTIKVVDYRKLNNSSSLKAVIVKPKLETFVVDNLGFAIVLEGDKIIRIEGVLPQKIVPIGRYEIKTIPESIKELEEKLRRGEPMRDWYISWMAFTEMNIQNITLTYRLNSEGYIVPVYNMHGTYMLDYKNLHEKGNITAMIVAIRIQ